MSGANLHIACAKLLTGCPAFLGPLRARPSPTIWGPAVTCGKPPTFFEVQSSVIGRNLGPLKIV
jgi:hypothetical protein